MSTASTARRPDFPANYIAHIRANLDKVDIILVSSHAEVRRALLEAGIKFALVYPLYDLKEEYRARYAQCGSSPEFIRVIGLRWEEWQHELLLQRGCTHIVLGPGQYLKDLYK